MELPSPFATEPRDQKEDEANLVSYAKEVEGATPQEPPPSPPAESPSLWDTAKNFASPKGLFTLWGAAQQIIRQPEWLQDEEDRTFKGQGEINAVPKPQHVETLRANQKNPDAVEAFDLKYGAGSSARYLNFAKKEHIDKLLENRNKPEAVEAFNDLYGPEMAKYYIPLYDKKTSAADRLQASLELNRIIREGRNWTDKVETSRPGEYTGSVFQGIEKAGVELERSGAMILDNGLRTNLTPYARDQVEDTRATTDPIINGIISTISQAATGVAVMNTVLPGAGSLGHIGSVIRGLGVGALTDAFAFNPDDPMIGDALKHFGMKPNTVTELFSTENYNSDGAKRAMRALEGSVLGVALEGAILLSRAAKLAKAGRTVEAEAVKEEAAKAFEKTEPAPKAEAAPVPRTEPIPEQVKPVEAPVEPKANPLRDLIETEQPATGRWVPDDGQLELPLPEPRKVEQVADQVAARSVEAEGTNASTSVPQFKPKDEVIPSTTPARVEKQTGAEMIRDIASRDPEAVRNVLDQIDPPPPRNPRDPVRKLLNEIPDLESARHDEVLTKVGPVVEKMTKLAEKLDDMIRYLSKEYSVDEVKKLSALVNAGTKAVTDRITELKLKADALMQSGKGAEADAILSKDLKDAMGLKAKFDTLDRPLGSVASVLMNIRQVEFFGVSAKAVRVRVEAMRNAGFTDTEIANMLVQISQEAKVSNAKLLGLEHKLTAAKEAANQVEAERIAKEIQAEVARMSATKTEKMTSKAGKLLDSLVEWKLNALLSNPKTVFIVNGVGNLLNITQRTIGEFLGQAWMRGSVSEAWAITTAKYMGMRSGYEHNLKMLSEMFQSGKRAFSEEQSHLFTETRLGEATSKGFEPSITAKNYGLNPEGIVGKSVDKVGGLVRVPSRLMAFTDEFLGHAVSRAEIGAEAAIRHIDTVKTRMKEVEAILKDQALPTERRYQLTAELEDLKAGKIDVDGVKMTRDEFIDHQIKSKFDEHGNLIDKEISRQTDEVLLKDKFTNETMKNIENVATMPVMRLLFQPFFRTPIRAMQRGFEFVPAFGQLISPQFRNDLNGVNGARAQAIAKGKVAQGWALTSWAFYKYMDGELTGPGPGDPQARQEWVNGGWRPMSIKVGDQWFDYSNLDPLSTTLKMIGTLADTYTMYNVRNPEKEDGQMQEMIQALGGVVIQGITNSSMLQGTQDLISLIKSTGEMGSTENDRAELTISRWTNKQATSFIPAVLKAMNELIDPRISDNVTLFQSVSSSLFNKDNAPMKYDYLGNPVVNTNPWKGVWGWLSPFDKPQMGKKEWVAASLANINKLTGAKFEQTSAAPGLPGSDMRLWPSITGKGTVKDTFMREYNTVKLDGLTVTDKLYAILSDKKYAIGTAEPGGKGDLIKIVKETAARYRKAAWITTQVKEQASPEMQEAMRKANQAKRDAHDPSKDRSLPFQITNPSVFVR